ncbi:MAG: hypothetical protein ACI9BD_000187 [Candidatus Marinamargulisbacteria bacterium]|jgi:hypothetical protein
MSRPLTQSPYTLVTPLRSPSPPSTNNLGVGFNPRERAQFVRLEDTLLDIGLQNIVPLVNGEMSEKKFFSLLDKPVLELLGMLVIAPSKQRVEGFEKMFTSFLLSITIEYAAPVVHRSLPFLGHDPRRASDCLVVKKVDIEPGIEPMMTQFVGATLLGVSDVKSHTGLFHSTTLKNLKQIIEKGRLEPRKGFIFCVDKDTWNHKSYGEYSVALNSDSRQITADFDSADTRPGWVLDDNFDISHVAYIMSHSRADFGKLQQLKVSQEAIGIHFPNICSFFK